MAINNNSTIAQTDRYTVTRLPPETGSGLQQFNLVIDETIVITLIESGPNALVVKTIDTNENANAQLSHNSTLNASTDYRIPTSALTLLEQETGMRFEGSADIHNPFTRANNALDTSGELSLADAM